MFKKEVARRIWPQNTSFQKEKRKGRWEHLQCICKGHCSCQLLLRKHNLPGIHPRCHDNSNWFLLKYWGHSWSVYGNQLHINNWAHVLANHKNVRKSLLSLKFGQNLNNHWHTFLGILLTFPEWKIWRFSLFVHIFNEISTQKIRILSTFFFNQRYISQTDSKITE